MELHDQSSLRLNVFFKIKGVDRLDRLQYHIKRWIIFFTWLFYFETYIMAAKTQNSHLLYDRFTCQNQPSHLIHLLQNSFLSQQSWYPQNPKMPRREREMTCT